MNDQTAPLITDLDSVLTQWDEAKRNADLWTVKERTLRQQIFNHMFTDPKVGTNKVRISHGMALIGDYKINYRIDRPLLESMGSDPELQPILAQFISYKPEVRDGAWRSLSDNERKRVAAAITEVPGLPGLEIKPQNKVRWK